VTGFSDKRIMWLSSGAPLDLKDCVDKGPLTVILSTEILVAESVTVPEQVSIQVWPGGALLLASGTTLEVQGPFSSSSNSGIIRGEGKIVFGECSVREVFPEWWGDSTSVEIQKAIAALSAGTVVLRGRYRMVCPVFLRDDVIIQSATRKAVLAVECKEVFCQTTGSVLRRSGLRALCFEASQCNDACILSLGTTSNCRFEDLEAGDFPDGTFARLLADDRESSGRPACATGNLFERIEIRHIHTGFDISGSESSWVTANTFRDIRINAVHGVGFIFRSYCDHDRFFDITIRLAADYAVGFLFNGSQDPAAFSYVYMQYFFGVTITTNVRQTEGQVGLLFNNTRGHLFFGLSFGSSVWRGTRIVDHGPTLGVGSNSYWAFGTVSWDLEPLSTWRKGGRTDRSGSAVVPIGAKEVEVRHGLSAAPTRVLLTASSDPFGRTYWVSRKTDMTFNICLNCPGERPVSFDWRAQVDEG
jgi:hypothetical protein